MIRVLAIDASAVARKHLKSLLSREPGIELVGSAMNADIALRKIEALQPDVLTLDVELLQRDGSAFLGELMQR